jgi:hypothetical protein
LVAHGRWFYPDTLASFTTKTGRHDIAEILLKVALNTINQIKKLTYHPLSGNLLNLCEIGTSKEIYVLLLGIWFLLERDYDVKFKEKYISL